MFCTIEAEIRRTTEIGMAPIAPLPIVLLSTVRPTFKEESGRIFSQPRIRLHNRRITTRLPLPALNQLPAFKRLSVETATPLVNGF
jgi:hypothetical protein